MAAGPLVGFLALPAPLRLYDKEWDYRASYRRRGQTLELTVQPRVARDGELVVGRIDAYVGLGAPARPVARAYLAVRFAGGRPARDREPAL